MYLEGRDDRARESQRVGASTGEDSPDDMVNKYRQGDIPQEVLRSCIAIGSDDLVSDMEG